MRIVSLLPSATEIVCAVGLEDSLVGVSHECDFPPSVRSLPKLTRSAIPLDASSAEIDRMVRERLQTNSALYTLDLPMLQTLRPDLIVTQALCDVCAVAEDEVRDAVRSLDMKPRVVNLEPQSLGDVLAAMRQVGAAADAERQADEAVAGLQARIDAVVARRKTFPSARASRCSSGSTRRSRRGIGTRSSCDSPAASRGSEKKASRRARFAGRKLSTGSPRSS